MIRRVRSRLAAVLGVVGLAAAAVATTGVARTARAHVRYVTDEEGEHVPLATFLREVLGEPANATLVLGGGLLLTGAVVGYFRYRPVRWDVIVARETLRQYGDLAPWLLRLSVGLPLIGAGFEGYFFSPIVQGPHRLFNVTVGFMLLFGLATRLAATVGLLTYLVGLVFVPDLLLASEFVGGFLGIMVLGSSRPSADQVFQQIAAAERTRYRPIAIVHRIADWLGRTMGPYESYAPTLVRIGLGFNFVYLGIYEKIAHAGRALTVVERYDLTAVVPVEPGMWVLGAGLTEAVLGFALLAGFFTRGAALIAFAMFTVTLFALPDDPVLAHISLFGMVSMLLITGSGPLAVDNRFRGQDAEVETSLEGE